MNKNNHQTKNLDGAENEERFLPTSVIVDSILSFLDRETWNHAIVGNREIYNASFGVDPPWPMERLIPTDHQVERMAFSSDGRYVCCYCGDHRTYVYHIRRGPYGIINMNTAVYSMCCSPVANVLLSCTFSGPCRFRIWDLDTLSMKSEIKLLDLEFEVFEGKFSPDGKLVAFYFAVAGTLQIYSVSETVLLNVLHVGSTSVLAGFTSDSLQVAISDRTAVTLWDVNGDDTTNETIYRASRREVHKIDFSPTQHLFAYHVGAIIKLVSSKNGAWTANEWTVKDLAGSDDSNWFLEDFGFTRDGRLLATRPGRGKLQIWDPVEGSMQYISTAAFSIYHAIFSQDGRLLASRNMDQSHGFILWRIHL